MKKKLGSMQKKTLTLKVEQLRDLTIDETNQAAGGAAIRGTAAYTCANCGTAGGTAPVPPIASLLCVG